MSAPENPLPHGAMPDAPPHPIVFAEGDPNKGRSCMLCGFPVPQGCRYVHAAWCDALTPAERKAWHAFNAPTDASADIPRRIRVDRMVPAELAIREAMLAVEAMPPDVRLTEAVALLAQAQTKVADFIDSAGGAS